MHWEINIQSPVCAPNASRQHVAPSQSSSWLPLHRRASINSSEVRQTLFDVDWLLIDSIFWCMSQDRRSTRCSTRTHRRRRSKRCQAPRRGASCTSGEHATFTIRPTLILSLVDHRAPMAGALPKSFAWLTGPGVFHGDLLFGSQNKGDRCVDVVVYRTYMYYHLSNMSSSLLHVS